MKTRRLGSQGLEVSELGLGCMGLTWAYGSADPDEATATVKRAVDLGVTFFGAGAAFYSNCMKAGVELSACGDLSAVRALGTTGSPLSSACGRWRWVPTG